MVDQTFLACLLLYTTSHSLLQGPMVLLERKITPQLQRLPRALRIVLTNSLLIAVGGPIFVQPTEASGFAGKHLGREMSLCLLCVALVFLLAVL